MLEFTELESIGRMNRILAFSLLGLSLLSLYACGQHGASPLFGGNAAPNRIGIKLISVGHSSTRQTSGLPTGVIVTWERSTDPRALGYYLYRDTSSIPDSPSPSLRVNGGNLIPHPASGDTVTWYDEFYPQVGTTYYYRVSVVDVAMQESDLSNEMSITIQSHSVGGMDPTSGYYGDVVRLFGENFGIFNPLTDFVRFPTDGSEWLDANILSWNENEGEIIVTVPFGAVSGPIQVVISSTVATTDEDFIILSPHLTSVFPQYASVGDTITIYGANLGDAPSGDDRVVFPGGTSVRYDSENILSWSSTSIEVVVPLLIENEGDIKVVVGGQETNGVFFSINPKLLEVLPRPIVPGSPNVYSLLGLNLGDKTSSTLLIVDLAPIPQPPITIGPENIVIWNNYEIRFTIPASLIGAIPAFRVVRGSLVSNDLVFVAFPLLSIYFVKPAQFSTLEESTEFVLSLQGWEMVEKVEFYWGPTMELLDVQQDRDVYLIELDPTKYRNGRYTIIAKAYRLSEVAQATITFDILSLVGDVNGDGFVDDLDVSALKVFFGKRSGEPSYRVYRDPNKDGLIDERDVSVIGFNFTGSGG